MRLDSDLAYGGAQSFTAGFVDTLGFVALFGLFTAHVTGNFVLIGAELAQPGHGILLKLLAFPAFVLAVAATRLLCVALERWPARLAAATLLLQLLLLVAFMVCGLAAEPIVGMQSAVVIAAGCLGAAAMGVQNAASRLIWGHLSPTTVMTGNVTQLVIDLVDCARGQCEPTLPSRLSKFFWPVLAFGLGALAGAWAYHHYAFWGLLLPILILLMQLVLSWRA